MSKNFHGSIPSKFPRPFGARVGPTKRSEVGGCGDFVLCYTSAIMRTRLIIITVFIVCLPRIMIAQECGSKRYCREMGSCNEARFYLEKCGVSRLDGDGDRSPCETLCGDGGNRTPATLTPLELSSKTPNQTCGTKTKCNQMTSCEEAQFYLTQCGVGRLDRDNDGVPCESICK